jgi:hypothetical protein
VTFYEKKSRLAKKKARSMCPELFFFCFVFISYPRVVLYLLASSTLCLFLSTIDTIIEIESLSTDIIIVSEAFFELANKPVFQIFCRETFEGSISVDGFFEVFCVS